MNNLSTLQKKVLNQISSIRDNSVLLGTLLDSVVQTLKRTGTPVNAVNASMVMTLSGVVKDGETFTVNNPVLPGTDVYEFLADEAQSKTAPTNIPVDITDYANKAYVFLTVDTKPTAGDTMTIGTKTYIFVPDGTDTADGEISIGTDLASAQSAIVAAINGTDEFNQPHPKVHAEAFAANISKIEAFVGGQAAHLISTTETFTAATNVFDLGNLYNGTDCSAANAITVLVAKITASDTQGVGAADGAGETIDLTADVAGVAGNDISLATTMANASFAGGADSLEGGVNGTVASIHTFMVDSNYLYFTIADNTTAGKNWRRTSAGSVY